MEYAATVDGECDDRRQVLLGSQAQPASDLELGFGLGQASHRYRNMAQVNLRSLRMPFADVGRNGHGRPTQLKSQAIDP